MPSSFPLNAWYAAAWDVDLKHALFPRTICGKHVVMYRQSNGRVCALEDACWHRLVPLSKGRLSYCDACACGIFNCEERLPNLNQVQMYCSSVIAADDHVAVEPPLGQRHQPVPAGVLQRADPAIGLAIHHDMLAADRAGNSACLRSTSQAAAYQALSGNDDGMAALPT